MACRSRAILIIAAAAAATAAPAFEAEPHGGHDSAPTFRTITQVISKDQVHASRFGAMRATHRPGEKKYTPQLDKAGHWHSQAGQDEAVSIALAGKRGGFFVDLASNEPVYISNSRALERDYGWSGICIDGNQNMLDKLVVQRTCSVYKGVVTSETGKVVEFTMPAAESTLTDKKTGRATKVDAEAGIGGILSNHTDNKEAGPEASKRRWIVTQHRTVTLTDILDHARAPATIDYLSLDIEGAEYDAMSTFAFDRYTFSLMTIERPNEQLRALLRTKDYVYLKDHGTFGDQMWAHRSVAAQAAARLGVRL